MDFDVDYALEILPGLISAARITLAATVGGFGLALVGGLFLVIVRMSPIPVVPLAAIAYVEFVRSTPLLTQLFFLYFILPLYGVRIDPLTTGILALGLHASTYTSEIYRAGIEGVPRGQWEAARALNYSPARTWTRIILPQAVPPVVPVLGNELIALFKATPLLATIAVRELLGQAIADASVSFRYLESFILVGMIFLILSLSSMLLVRVIERVIERRTHG
jgi:polar amino acid transport system permease protein